MAKLAWYTPDSVPPGLRCIQLLVPDDEEFFAMLIGAITPLFSSENFEQHGTLTPEECAEWWREWDAQQDYDSDCP